MPLVRISLMEGKSPGFGRQVGAVVYRTMADTLNLPPQDNFRIITEHGRDGLVYDPEYLGIARTDGVLLIQIRLNEGRTVELKKAFYQLLANRLHQECQVRKDDVFVSLVEVMKENWSFGNGMAQYAP